MSVVGSSVKLVLVLAAVAAGTGYAAVKGLLPDLPYGINETVKSYTLAVADRAGVKLEAKANPANPQVGPVESAKPATPPTVRPPANRSGEGQPPARPGGGQGQSQGSGGGGDGGANPPVSVRMAAVEQKTMPVRFDTIGIVQTVKSVTVRSRVDSQVLDVTFEDGTMVKAGTILFRLDARQIDAMIRQAEANMERDKAQLALAEVDVKRKQALVAKEASSQALLDTSKANAEVLRAQIKADEAAIDNLRVQRGYYDVTAPIDGRVGVAGLKVGNIAKQGDGAPSLATINQMSPIYVAFPVPQRLVMELRDAVAAGTAMVVATPQGMNRSVTGKVAVLDNAVDTGTGTLVVRAIFENGDELLWPGSLVDTRITLRLQPDAIVVPNEAVQTSQQGNYVFVVADGAARMRPVKVDRSVEGQTVIAEGLKSGEVVVTDGHLRLRNGSRVYEPGRSRPPVPTPAAVPPTAGPGLPTPPATTPGE